MDDNAKQASRAIDSVAKALANWTVSRLAEVRPQVAQRYGAAWRNGWTAHVESQVAMLAQAVAVRRPALFAESAVWTRAAFNAREVDESDLRASLESLRETVDAELPSTLAGSAVECIDAALRVLDAGPPEPGSSKVDDSPQRTRLLRYLEAVLDGRSRDAHMVILQAVEAGLSIPDVYEHILQPAQIELGRLWHAGEISVADEHFGSATTQTVMSLLRSRFPSHTGNGRVLVATSVGGDLHAIGVRMVADAFEVDGWTTHYLGANTPSSDLIELIKARNAHLLAVSASTPLHVRDLGELIEDIRSDASVAKTRILVGGPPFQDVPDLWEELGADGSAGSATEAVRVGNALVATG